jgi:hypothetical protein
MTGSPQRDVSKTFDDLCAEAEAEARKQPVSEEILRARRLLTTDDVSTERAWAEV